MYDSSLPVPAILDHTPLNNLITSLLIPDKTSLTTTPPSKKTRSSFSSAANSQSSSIRKFRGTKMKNSELMDVQRLIEWSS